MFAFINDAGSRRATRRCILLASFCLAVSTGTSLAQMPVKAAPPQQALAVDWTGFYAGAHIGNAAVSNQWNSSSAGPGIRSPFPGAFTSGGNVGGVQFGYNYQIGRWVL